MVDFEIGDKVTVNCLDISDDVVGEITRIYGEHGLLMVEVTFDWDVELWHGGGTLDVTVEDVRHAL